jgi:hypothetical protein
MTTPLLIAECSLYAVDQTGEGYALRIGLGQPWREEDGTWKCAARIDGMDLAVEARGIDSWQALHLGYQWLSNVLTLFVRDGGRLYDQQGGEEASLTDFIIPLTTH